ncbi:proline dehydrogenase family protein [Lysinibacillus varians]|uniref:proline dehydrogenase n=1 Tax=Lysinibacillus varians TaxID=1145276 RepID=A0ABY2T917_9BACI|nr:proline dehydrogenase family protein [Lysinibacillus varians]AHN23638.1 proline dehydrogenase [Lysinibacillus varians]TKI61972.1 proline dehydrogenase [Lysinibacillus varians]
MKKPQELVMEALKSAARNNQMKDAFQQSKELYPLLLKAAKRYVAGEVRADAIAVAENLLAKDYQVSLEFIGENTVHLEECQKAVKEFMTLIDEMGTLSLKQTVSFDLSHIGLSIDKEIAYKHLLQLVQHANTHGIILMVSMEESSKTDAILDIYKKIAAQYDNIGITVQAHLYRTEMDLQELVQYPGKIRIVKGAFQEPSTIAMERSEALNRRYLQFIDQLIKWNHPFSIATHDEALIQEMEQRHYFHQSNVEIEMLYGIRPDLIRSLQRKGYNCKVYLPYGQEWYLYLCHRLAENPENLYLAVTDMLSTSLLDSNEGY